MTLKQAILAVVPQSLMNRHYERQIRESTIQDEPDLACLPALLQPDWYCLDIGANIGRYTKHLSQLSAGVLAVEPTPFTFKVLSNTVHSLGMKNVTVVQCAISDQSGSGSMSVPNIYEAQLTVGNDFPVRTVDELASGLARVDFIKCDTEGHELKCVLGAKQTIERCRPIWLIETAWDSPLFALMETLGYRCYVEDQGKLRPRGPQERKTNYFFKHTAA